MKRILIAIGLSAALAACVTSPGAPSAGGGGAAIPRSPVDFGNWREASEAATLQAFRAGIEGRYGAGLSLQAVSADLRANEFTCGAAPPRAEGGRGDPPVQVCRRTLTQAGCTHTWQVHVFDTAGDGRLARSRGLYDRRCGGDGLLGGPG